MTNNDTYIEAVSKLLELAQEFEKKGNVQAALDTYNHALVYLPEGSLLRKEVLLLMGLLEGRSKYIGTLNDVQGPVRWQSNVWMFLLIGLALIGILAFAFTNYGKSPIIEPTSFIESTPTTIVPSEESPVLTSPSDDNTQVVLTLSPTPQVITLTVKARRVALRAGPDIKHPESSSFYLKGTEMVVLEKYKEWFYVQAPDGERGWLFLGWINIDPSLLIQISTANDIPTPPSVPVIATRKPDYP
jgi:hypothetical protein